MEPNMTYETIGDHVIGLLNADRLRYERTRQLRVRALEKMAYNEVLNMWGRPAKKCA